MKIVLWIGDGTNQKALANKIYSMHKIDLIIIERKNVKVKLTFSRIIQSVVDKLFFSSLNNAWSDMLSYYQSNYNTYPSAQIIYTDNINDDESYKATTYIEPDLIIVSGTRMIREKLLTIKPSMGIMNLHTGLSPYIKGGPNCTNWCLASNQFHLIGNTIMWIDEGIDSGNIITTEVTSLTGNESLSDIHLKVMEHAHGLYLNAINEIVKGKHSNVPQETITKGKTYYTRDWNTTQKLNALKNYKKFNAVLSSKEYKLAQLALKTVSITT
jgi:methionyl-tRNA formyltransferase